MQAIQKYLPLLLIAILFAACSGKSSSTPATPATPEASVNNISQDRGITNTIFHFSVSISKTSTSEISVHYSTLAGTAKENTDFLPVSGTLTIPANTSSATIDVEVTGDSLRKANQQFYLQMDNPKNCTLKTAKGIATIVNENGLYFPVDNTGYTTPGNYPGYTLAWSDEFDGNSVKSGNWTFETGGNGWGNSELENYTNRTQNAFVSQGNLVIEARAENYNGNGYTSARMVSKGKQEFTYGRVDIRAKLPTGKGIWPALWMLGSNIDGIGWPACGEIDIMELLGQEPNKVYGTLHWGNTVAAHESKGTNYVLSTGNFNDQFHVYSMLWQQDSIKLYIDDNLFFSGDKSDVTGNAYPFNSNFFFIFNIAVGGNWPGSPDGNTVFPQRMIVDYVRIFQ